MAEYKKKRYDIHIRMYPEDFEALWTVLFIVDDLPLNEGCRKEINRLEKLNGKLHNKMVEINRR